MLGAVGLLFRHLDGPRVVARAVAPDGTEMEIIQRCNWSGEPFTTGFYFRPAGATRWGWFYVDHEDDYWSGRTSSTVVNTNEGKAYFYRRGELAATFDWASEEFHLVRLNRTSTGAQSWLADGQAPR